MLLSFAIRSGVVAAAIYYSRKLGTWGNSQETEAIYNDIKNELRPQFKSLEEKLPFEFPALPRTGEVSFLAKHYYNQGVKETFHFIGMLPCYTGQVIQLAKDTFVEFSKSPMITSNSKE